MKTQSLGLTSLVLLVIASMIGFGVFSSSGYALADLGSPRRVLTGWALCGLWAISGAVAYGALAKHVQLSGGEYVYLSRLLHPMFGFLAGWISLIAGFTLSITGAALAVVSYGMPNVEAGFATNCLATIIIVIAALCHAAKVSFGVIAQNSIVFIKLAAIAALLIWAFFFTPLEAWQGITPNSKSVSWLPEDTSAWLKLFASMSWFALSYAGFNAAVYVAAESHHIKRNVPLAMVLATVLVTGIYLMLNYIFVYGPSQKTIMASQQSISAIGATATRSLGGSSMELLTRAIVTLGVLSSVFAMLLAGPRVYLQMARDGVMPKFLKSKGAVPRRAIITQALLSVVVLWITDLRGIISYLGLTLSLCSALTVATVFRLASVDLNPNDEIPKVHWYEKLAAAAYILGTMVMMGAVITRENGIYEVLASAITFVSGTALYLVWSILRPSEAESP